MVKFAIKPVDVSGAPITRAKTTQQASTPDDPKIKEKALAAVKRAGARCARVIIEPVDGSKGLQLVWDREAHPIVTHKTVYTSQGTPIKRDIVTRKKGPNSMCRKAKIRALYQDGTKQEDAWKAAQALDIKPSSFKTWWSEFRRLGYPRKGDTK